MMNNEQRFVLATLAFALGCACATSSIADQETLQPVVNAASRTLEFDWPMVQIGTSEYTEGPTGVTVFRFGRRVLSAMDVRGGGPGTVNSDYVRLGYDAPELDAVVFAGGSWYGLEATTAVASALKDDGVRGGHWTNLALSVGSIIYDLGDRRLNEIYPDKRLAQAAYRGARPGVFPLGAQGAGRFARSGGFFGCNAYSGQGGAFRQIGDVKVAAFAVVNALGVVTKRDGSVAACYAGKDWPQPLTANALMSNMPASSKPQWSGTPGDDGKRNTTVSLVITNQTLNPAELQRLAVQVHTSMARGLQPFATEYDGDVLYAVSTAELERRDDASRLTPIDLGVVASEVMWDAILASVPEQPQVVRAGESAKQSMKDLKRYAGEYAFSEFVSVRITARDGRLFAQSTGERDAYAIERDARVELVSASGSLFTIPGRYPLTLTFDDRGRLVINPGHWQQVGVRKQP